jgi:hypothetical protein
MRQPSRLHRIAKWIGLVACVVLVALFVVSAPYWIEYWFNYGRHVGNFACGGGCVTVVWNVRPQLFGASRLLPMWLVHRRTSSDIWVWWPFLDARFLGGYLIRLPVWMPLAVFGPLTALLWYRDRRRPMPGHCRKCDYDLRGNVSGICPECGLKIAAPEASPKSRP